MRKRTKFVQDYVLKRLEKPFKLETKDKFELDSEKRSRVRDVKDLEKLWDQILLVDVLNNYINLQDEQNPEKQRKR